MPGDHKGPVLPLSRIKTIMKSSPETFNIGQDALVMIAKAAELMIEHLTKETYRHSKDKRYLNYKELSELVNNCERLEFLQDIIPPKVKLRDYLKILEKVEEEERKNEDI